ncbi:hypothetical protein NQ314_018811 [Rhamnusium bicolor]|uniref:Uncharacterized protein n=1 Tax=Rhamnusium bicolor TaxID=1586634 RepID=A0AAV8WQ15_9CUCU|nr:hypothetical protein NQ314_018811 [Rhamnusium bicolor]
MRQDRYLRQILDQEKIIQCMVKDDAFLIKSKEFMRALKNELKEGQINHRYEKICLYGITVALKNKHSFLIIFD